MLCLNWYQVEYLSSYAHITSSPAVCCKSFRCLTLRYQQCHGIVLSECCFICLFPSRHTRIGMIVTVVDNVDIVVTDPWRNTAPEPLAWMSTNLMVLFIDLIVAETLKTWIIAPYLIWNLFHRKGVTDVCLAVCTYILANTIVIPQISRWYWWKFVYRRLRQSIVQRKRD